MLAVCLRTALMVGIERGGGYVNVKGGGICIWKTIMCAMGWGYQGSMGMFYALIPYSPCPLPCPLGGLDGVALPFALTLCHALL